RSRDGGRHWQRLPSRPAFTDQRCVRQIWQLQVGHPKHPGELWAGTGEAGLFRSVDAGHSWQGVAGLNDHPTRATWDAGGGGLILHSILIDPHNPARLFVGISAGGVYRSDDDADSWQAINRGMRPDPRPEACAASGQCPHKILLHPTQPGLLYQQGHCGVYRSIDYGDSWHDISAGLPSSFGWPLAIHPHNPELLYVVPHISDKQRRTTEDRLAVWCSDNAGTTWQRLTHGLPTTPALCLRESLTLAVDDPSTIYLGTTDGRVFCSRDQGESWVMFLSGLPAVQVITTITEP
ncbi:MAG TPA: exo-alpha-sialidase, partial [Roseiflexaceae bacterium]|nr:exo-alpha-sialidase [Roseiflexaceae bacterium]